MDTRTALDILKRWPADETVALSAEQEEALQLLEQDRDLDRMFRQLDTLDERISWSMSDVAVNEDAKSRLLAALQTESAAESQVERADPPTAVSRRSALRRAVGLVSASALMLAIAGWLALNRDESSLSLAELRQAVPELWSGELHEFDGSFAATLPEGGWQSNRIRFDGQTFGVRIKGAEQHQVAVRRFSIPMSGGRTTEGMLLILPAESFADAERPRPGDYLSGGAPKYVGAEDRTQLAVVSWTEGDCVYLCVLPAGPSEDALKRALNIAVS